MSIFKPPASLKDAKDAKMLAIDPRQGLGFAAEHYVPATLDSFEVFASLSKAGG